MGDFDKSVASHVLNALVRLVHELEELVDNSLQELPVGAQKAGIAIARIVDPTDPPLRQPRLEAIRAYGQKGASKTCCQTEQRTG